jgi:hypothetical protein
VELLDLDGDGRATRAAENARLLCWESAARRAPVPSLLGAHEPRLLRRPTPRGGWPLTGARSASRSWAPTAGFPGAAAGRASADAGDRAAHAGVAPPASCLTIGPCSPRARAARGPALVRSADGKVLDSFKLENLKTDPRAAGRGSSTATDGRATACRELPRPAGAGRGRLQDVNVAQSWGRAAQEPTATLWWGRRMATATAARAHSRGPSRWTRPACR